MYTHTYMSHQRLRGFAHCPVQERGRQEKRAKEINMQCRYAAMRYTHSNTLAQQLLDRPLYQVCGQLMVEVKIGQGVESKASSQHRATLGDFDMPDANQSAPWKAFKGGYTTYARGRYEDLNKAYICSENIYFETKQGSMVHGAQGPAQITQHTEPRQYVLKFLCNKAANLQDIVQHLCKLPPYRPSTTCKYSKREKGGRVLYLVTFVTCLHALLWRKRERDCFYYIIEQTYDVGLHSRRHPMEFDAGTRPFASFDAPSS